jgi:hypothetical protein
MKRGMSHQSNCHEVPARRNEPPGARTAQFADTRREAPARSLSCRTERAATSEGDPAEGAAGAVRLALLPDDGPTGEFLSWEGTVLPW